MNAAMLLNHDPATVICRDVRSVSQVIAGWTIWRMITKVAKAWDCIMPVGTRDGRADGCSNTVERSLHANRSWTCSNEERRLWLRLLDARRGPQPGVHLRSHRRRPLRAQRRDQIPQQGKFGSDYCLQHSR